MFDYLGFVPAPDGIPTTASPYRLLIEEFLNSNESCISRTFEDASVAESFISSLRSAIERGEHPVQARQRKEIVYLQKIDLSE